MPMLQWERACGVRTVSHDAKEGKKRKAHHVIPT